MLDSCGCDGGEIGVTVLMVGVDNTSSGGSTSTDLFRG